MELLCQNSLDKIKLLVCSVLYGLFRELKNNLSSTLCGNNPHNVVFLWKF